MQLRQEILKMCIWTFKNCIKSFPMNKLESPARGSDYLALTRMLGGIQRSSAPHWGCQHIRLQGSS